MVLSAKLFKSQRSILKKKKKKRNLDYILTVQPEIPPLVFSSFFLNKAASWSVNIVGKNTVILRFKTSELIPLPHSNILACLTSPLKLQAIHTGSWLPSPSCSYAIRRLAPKTKLIYLLCISALVLANIPPSMQTETLLSRTRVCANLAAMAPHH